VSDRPDPVDVLASIPDGPGVYLWKDPRGRTMYVGKARNLRRRVAQYFQRPDADAKTRALLAGFASIETILTDNEVEALSLENTLIKKHRPRYNVLLRDDKTYPYIKVTTGEEWPRAFVTRKIRDDGHSYFGPYIPGGRARQVMKMLTRHLRIRTCRIEIDGRLPRPCLYYDLHACPGPCVEGLTTKEEYAAAVEEAILFLKGRTKDLVAKLSRRMEEAAAREEFELAAHFRDLVRAIDRPAELKTESTGGEDLDAFGLHEEGGSIALAVLVMRDGRTIDRRELFWERLAEPGDFDAGAFLAEVLPQLYSATDFLPAEIHLPVALPSDEETSVLEAWLTDKRGGKVAIRVPERGEKRRRVELAEKNARSAHAIRFRKPGEGKDPLARLVRLLALPSPPVRIEGFDISHHQGDQTYASMVVFEGGRPARRSYRLFSIESVTNDDFAALAEAVTRRYRRLSDEGRPLPDLVLVDGGRGQLSSASGALAELGLEIPMVSLAKKEEELFLVGKFRPLRLSRSDPGLQLLQRVRDEAHRFAITAHRRQRSRTALRSPLAEIPGLGPARIRALLRRFGSFAGVAGARPEELAELLGEALGARVGEWFRGAREASGGRAERPGSRPT
jgi:excinuclease ABC subunit C